MLRISGYITNDKVTVFFCIVDDFCNIFEIVTL